jgi:hypothetical protein
MAISRVGTLMTGGQHGESHLEVVVVAPALAADAPVVEVHHAVRSALELGQALEVRVDIEGAGGATAHDLHGQAVLLEEIARLHELVHPAMRRLAPVRVARHMGAVSGIALEAAQIERALQRDHAPDMDGGLARLRTRPPPTHVHVHEDVEHLARGGHGLAELADIVGIVHHHQRLRRLLQHAHQPPIFSGPTTSVVMSMLRMPAAAITSASPTLAQQMPTAPAAI